MGSATARLLAGVLVLDRLIEKKATAADPWSRALVLERRYFQALALSFLRRAREGTQKATRWLASSSGPITEREAARAARMILQAFDGWRGEMDPITTLVVGEAYKLGKDVAYEQANRFNRNQTPVPPYDPPHLDATDVQKVFVQKATQAELENGLQKLDAAKAELSKAEGALAAFFDKHDPEDVPIQFQGQLAKLKAAEESARKAVKSWTQHVDYVKAQLAADAKAAAEAKKPAPVATATHTAHATSGPATAKDVHEAHAQHSAASNAAETAFQKLDHAKEKLNAFFDEHGTDSPAHEAEKKQLVAEANALALAYNKAKAEEKAAADHLAAVEESHAKGTPAPATTATGGKPPKKGKQGEGGGPKKGGKFFEVKPNFDLVDAKAIHELKEKQLFWIGKHTANGEKLSNQITAQAMDVVNAGFDRRQAAKDFEQKMAAQFGYDPNAPTTNPTGGLTIPDAWRGSSLSYFEMLGANAVTTARNTGQIRSYSQIGITDYGIVNPEDERTCETCRFMAGKHFEVESAVKRQESILDTSDPEKIKDIHPWEKRKEILSKSGASDKDGHVSKEDSKKLEAAGFSYPPYHGRCRCSVDITESAEVVFSPEPEKPVPEEPSPAPAAAPLPSPIPEPVAAPPPPPPKPVPPPPPPVTAGPMPGVFPWREDQLKKLPIQLDGVHTKVVYEDPNGDRWIFKPQDEFRAFGDKAAADFAQLLGRDTAEVYVTTSAGKIGSMQKMFKGVEGDFGGLDPSALKPDQAKSLQHEHVFDWLISQHDTHEHNVLRMADGSLKFIDKGQTFRFFGKDRLDLEYGKLGDPNPVTTYYHSAFNAYAQGKDVKIQPREALEEFIKRIENTPRSEFIKVLKPYADAAWAAGEKSASVKASAWMGQYNSPGEFMSAVLARKENIRAEIDRFYKELEEKRNKALGIKAPKKPRGKKPKVSETPTVEGEKWKARLVEADKAGWAGSSFYVKGPDFENGNMLLYTADGDGTFMEGKLRARADRRLRALVGKADTDPQSVNDPFYNDVLTITKSFNAHLDPKHKNYDGKVPPHTEKLLQEVSARLGEYRNEMMKIHGAEFDSTAEGKLWSHYQKYLHGADGIYGSVPGTPTGEGFKPSAVGKQLDKFVPPPPTAKKGALPDGWTVEKVDKGDPIRRQFEDGRIVKKPGQPLKQLQDKGQIFLITADDGTRIYYRPHDDSVNYSAQGQIRVWTKDGIKNLSGEKAAQIHGQLAKLGLETGEGQAADHELVYLRKLAFKVRLDQEALKHVGEDAPQAEQITKLKAFLAKEAKIDFGPKSGYDPRPTHDAGGNIGWGKWYGHHIKDEDIKELRLFLSLHKGPDEDVRAIFGGKSNTLVTTVEKQRMGFPVSGMSPERDMETGGANYVFTRVRSADHNERGFLLKPHIFRDLDSITYADDKYGRSDPKTLKERLGQDSWRMLNIRKSSDETIFKNQVDLIKYLDQVSVGNEYERKKVLEVFREQGITHIGGRPVEQAVKVSGYR